MTSPARSLGDLLSTMPMIANTNGLVTVGGKPVGRRNRLHVPHDAAAMVTIARPAASDTAAAGDGVRGSLTRGIVARVREHERVQADSIRAELAPRSAHDVRR